MADRNRMGQLLGFNRLHSNLFCIQIIKDEWLIEKGYILLTFYIEKTLK